MSDVPWISLTELIRRGYYAPVDDEGSRIPCTMRDEQVLPWLLKNRCPARHPESGDGCLMVAEHPYLHIAWGDLPVDLFEALPRDRVVIMNLGRRVPASRVFEELGLAVELAPFDETCGDVLHGATATQ